MLYHISRNGQNYGPYTLEDLRRYVASGHVLTTDLAKSDEMPEWIPVAQVLGGTIPVAAASAPPPGVGGMSYMPGVAAYPDPPDLHWVLVVVIGLFTCGLFFSVWDIVQSVWMRRVNARSNALFLYIGEFAVSLLGTTGRVALIFTGAMHGMRLTYPFLGLMVFAVGVTLLELARFDMLRSLEEHYNGPEPIGLRLSGVMTFFFGSLYFQYHFTRITQMKRMARYRGAAI